MSVPRRGLDALTSVSGSPAIFLGFSVPAWMADAVCAETDPEAFFPEKGGSNKEAKAMCARCTVAAECLDYALASGEGFGIYGGLSARERRHLSKSMKEAS